MEDKITIDKETLKAIASDTRLNILKSLEKKKKTLSDLSQELKLSNPTIKEHLEVLSKAGLVKKEESLRKWKYYSLTFKGKQLLRPNETRFFLALLLTIVGIIGFALFLTMTSTIGGAGHSNKNLAQSEMVRSLAADYSVASSAVSSKPQFNYSLLFLSVLILIVVIIIIFYIKKKKNK